MKYIASSRPQSVTLKKIRNKKLRVIRSLQNQKRNLKTVRISTFDLNATSDIEALQKQGKPFKIVVENKNELTKIFTKMNKPIHSLKDLIPTHLINNLDIIASRNDKFEGSQATKDMITMTFDDFIKYDGVLNLYLAQIPLYESFNGVELEIINSKLGANDLVEQMNVQQQEEATIRRPQELIGKSTLKSVNLWATKGSTDSGWHYDSYENYLIVLQGVKVVWLSKSASNWNDWINISDDQYNHIRPNKIQKGAKFTLLKENEILHIPQGYLHRVLSIQDSIALNVWFGGIQEATLKPSFYQMRYQMSELLKVQVQQKISLYVKKKLKKSQSSKQFQKIAKNKEFSLLTSDQRYRTKNTYSFSQQLALVVYHLNTMPSVNMIELIKYLIDISGADTESLLRQLNQYCQIIIASKLNDFSQKEQFHPLNIESLYKDYQHQRIGKVIYREQFFTQFWNVISNSYFDHLESISKKFQRKQLENMVQPHIQ